MIIQIIKSLFLLVFLNGCVSSPITNSKESKCEHTSRETVGLSKDFCKIDDEKSEDIINNNLKPSRPIDTIENILNGILSVIFYPFIEVVESQKTNNPSNYKNYQKL